MNLFICKFLDLKTELQYKILQMKVTYKQTDNTALSVEKEV